MKIISRNWMLFLSFFFFFFFFFFIFLFFFLFYFPFLFSFGFYFELENEIKTKFVDSIVFNSFWIAAEILQISAALQRVASSTCPFPHIMRQFFMFHFDHFVITIYFKLKIIKIWAWFATANHTTRSIQFCLRSIRFYASLMLRVSC